MSPDEARGIESKIDKLFGVTSKMATDVEVLKTEFKAHREADEERHGNRSVTCPTAPRVSRLEQRFDSMVANIDALAGIQRADHAELKKLNRWRDDLEKMRAVDEVTDDLTWRPVRWLIDNSEKVGIALMIAYLIVRFGL